MLRKVLCFHIYPVNNWKEVAEHLLKDVPHDDIFVHVSFPLTPFVSQTAVEKFLVSFGKVRAVYISENSSHPEVDAMQKFLEHVDLSMYRILTYMHTKGVTKPDNQNISDWTELMRYFIVEKMSLCEKVFSRNYLLYGVNRTRESNFENADFFYAGNFVSVNLTSEMVSRMKQTPISSDYHGLEGFWGKLCTAKQAYNAFYSRIDHYSNPFPDHYYKSTWGRLRYTVTSMLYFYYYRTKHLFLKKIYRGK